MRYFEYEKLKRSDYQQIVEITSSKEPFAVLAEEEIGRQIQSFLNVEREYRSSQRLLGDRLRYWWKGMAAVHLPGFMPIWNRAVMDGYSVEVFRRDGGTYELVFTRS
jgi:hypothetical protein